MQTISEGCCSENVRVGITLETIRYVGGVPYLMMQTLTVKLMNVLDLLSFSYPRLLLETLLPRRLKKNKTQTWQSCIPGDCLGDFLASSNLLIFGS